MFKIKIEEDKFIEFHTDKGEIKVNNERFDWNLAESGRNKFHIIKDNKTYRIEVIKFEPAGKKLSLKINDKLTEIKVQDEQDLLLEKFGIKTNNASAADSVKAPMPGLILDIKVSEGQTVAKGESIIILEAMKMENIIKCPGDGQVSAILVKKGQSVEKNQVLIKL